MVQNGMKNELPILYLYNFGTKVSGSNPDGSTNYMQQKVFFIRDFGTLYAVVENRLGHCTQIERKEKYEIFDRSDKAVSFLNCEDFDFAIDNFDYLEKIKKSKLYKESNMRKLTKADTDFYLTNGNLTQPFISNEYVLEKVLCDYNHKIEKGIKITKIESLFNWINHVVKFGDKEFNDKYRFQRTAKEIWDSKIMTGCTDYATLFATFARQIGIPTTILHTAERSWVERLQHNKDFSHHYGHSFCECFYEGKWILVDPTFRKIEKEYNPEKLELGYMVGGSSTFIPYQRGIDLEIKQTTSEHNSLMDKLCKNLKI